MRVCGTCHIEKDINEFNGGRNHCKKCNRLKYYEKLKSGKYSDLINSEKNCTYCNIQKKSSDFRVHKSYCKKC
jgi:hypothetical protein